MAEGARLTLAQARLRRLWSPYKLSKQSGVALTTILAIERGTIKRPHLETIEKLAQALGVRPEDIAWPGDPLSLGNDPAD